jgi:hypothetical protein
MPGPTKIEAVRLAAVQKWRAADEELTRARNTEAELRTAAIAAVWPKGLGMGTTNHVLCDGSTLKGVVRREAKVDQTLIRAAEAKLRKLGEAGALLADRLIRWTADASVSEFDKLDTRSRRLVSKAIAIVLARPSLKLVPPE